MAKRMLKVRIADGNFVLKDGYISIDDITMFRESNVDCNHLIVNIYGREYLVYKKFSELEQEILNKQ